jgi:hypothetical protein
MLAKSIVLRLNGESPTFFRAVSGRRMRTMRGAGKTQYGRCHGGLEKIPIYVYEKRYAMKVAPMRIGCNLLFHRDLDSNACLESEMPV